MTNQIHRRTRLLEMSRHDPDAATLLHRELCEERIEDAILPGALLTPFVRPHAVDEKALRSARLSGFIVGDPPRLSREGYRVLQPVGTVRVREAAREALRRRFGLSRPFLASGGTSASLHPVEHCPKRKTAKIEHFATARHCAWLFSVLYRQEVLPEVGSLVHALERETGQKIREMSPGLVASCLRGIDRIADERGLKR